MPLVFVSVIVKCSVIIRYICSCIRYLVESHFSEYHYVTLANSTANGVELEYVCHLL